MSLVAEHGKQCMPCSAYFSKTLLIETLSTETPGRGCSKLTMSLVNVSLKFQTLISEKCQNFLLKNVRSFCSAKASLIFSTKNFSLFGYKFVKHLTS